MTTISGFRPAIGSVLQNFEAGFGIPIAILLLVLVFPLVFRRSWLANLLLLAVVAGLSFAAAQAQNAPWLAIVQPLVVAISILVLTRLGFLAMVVTVHYSEWAWFPLTLDTGSWYFPWAVVTMVCFSAVAVYGFVVSLGGQKVFSDPLEGQEIP